MVSDDIFQLTYLCNFEKFRNSIHAYQELFVAVQSIACLGETEEIFNFVYNSAQGPSSHLKKSIGTIARNGSKVYLLLIHFKKLLK